MCVCVPCACVPCARVDKCVFVIVVFWYIFGGVRKLTSFSGLSLRRTLRSALFTRSVSMSTMHVSDETVLPDKSSTCSGATCLG